MEQLSPGRLRWGDLACPAGVVTLVRLPLAVVFPLVVYNTELALAVYAVAMLSDFLDGILARHMNQVTFTGAIADGWLDKAFHVNAAWAMALAGIIPGWWMLLWFSREIIHFPMIPFLAGPYVRGEVVAQHASAVGKATSWALGGAFLASLLGWVSVAGLLTWLTGGLGLWCAMGYVRRLSVQKRVLAAA